MEPRTPTEWGADLRGAVWHLLLTLAPLSVLAPAADGLAAPSPAASDTVVVVVSAESPVTGMSQRHLTDLYLGRTNRFPDGTSAIPVDQEPGSAARDVFYETYLGRSPAQVKAHWSKLIFTGRGHPPVDVPSNEDVKEMVADDPRAIGYLEARIVDESVRVLPLN